MLVVYLICTDSINVRNRFQPPCDKVYVYVSCMHQIEYKSIHILHIWSPIGRPKDNISELFVVWGDIDECASAIATLAKWRGASARLCQQHYLQQPKPVSMKGQQDAVTNGLQCR
jgi:hypothetical protein